MIQADEDQAEFVPYQHFQKKKDIVSKIYDRKAFHFPSVYEWGL